MNAYIISYDLHNPGQNYENLIRKIKSYKIWARLGGSAYIIMSDQTVAQVRDNLLSYIDMNDKLFVGTIKAPAAWYGLGDDVSDWLRNKLNT